MTHDRPPNDPALTRYWRLLRYRRFDEACLLGVASREIHGELHLGMGQEAISAGMAPALRPDDAMVSSHRNHAHALAKGVDPGALMAEIYEKETGLCGGFGGHMHPFDPTTNFSATGIVGASLPVAAGYAYGYQLRAEPHVAVAPIGDGAANTGGFHETMVMAGAWKLPLVVVIENNDWAISVRTSELIPTASLAERASGYAAWGQKVDGTDPETVESAFAEAVEHARSGAGPAILEATCHRFRGHFEGDHDTYRDREERKQQRDKHDPVILYRARLLNEGRADEATLNRLDKEVRSWADDLLKQVRAASQPAADTMPREWRL